MDNGLEYLERSPSSFTPTRQQGKYLILGGGDDEEQIAKWSTKDAGNFAKYEEFLGACRDIIRVTLDHPMPQVFGRGISFRERIRAVQTAWKLTRVSWKNRKHLAALYELFTGPAQQILDRWFESEILKTTLATDAVIGAMLSPKQAGSSYVLLHHVMGEVSGKQGIWAYVRGGMGRVSDAIAACCRERGVKIACDVDVDQILVENFKATGVRLLNGVELKSNVIISGATPYQTFWELMPWNNTAEPYEIAEYRKHIRFQDNGCGAFKINCVVNRLPEFQCLRNVDRFCPSKRNTPFGPQHKGTIHFEEKMEELENAYREASAGIPATKPAVEMTIPSSCDATLSPEGSFVVQLFVQYAPYDLDPKVGHWADPDFKAQFVKRVFSVVDQYTVDSFTDSVVSYDALSPLDLEQIFSLHRGNIFHGSLSLHQLAYARPVPGWSSHKTPVKNLYLCGAGTHPGGGVMGAAGRNCAMIVADDVS